MDIIKGNGNFCAVMDNNQSIYAFRGAEIDFICKQIVDGGFDQYVLLRKKHLVNKMLVLKFMLNKLMIKLLNLNMS